MNTIANIEAERLLLQKTCDDAKTQRERNRLGQFATPPALARTMLTLAKSLLPTRSPVRFLDPAFGTGSFYSALLEIFPSQRITRAVGFEIDPHYAHGSKALWKSTELDLRIADFTAASAPLDTEKFSIVVCNPPYVRHHHLTGADKSRLNARVRKGVGLNLNGLSGLYCYFLMLADEWVSEGGLCLWLVPSEFMDVNYGVEVKKYLLSKVTLLQVHRFDSNDMQFGDALVSSCVVCFRKATPERDHNVKLSFGGSLAQPNSVKSVPASQLSPLSKWNGSRCSVPQSTKTRLSDWFDIKRGLATGDNRFFILTPEKVKANRLPAAFLKPILPSPRFLSSNEVNADINGNPVLEAPSVFA